MAKDCSPCRRRWFRRAPREDGAMLVHVAILLVVFMAFTAFAMDHGLKLVSRGQAQNAADAGAFAGALSLALDDFEDRTESGPAKLSAFTVARQNTVWAEVPDVDITTDVTFPPCPDDGTNGCVRVDAYRNQVRGNPLPTFFGRFLGIEEQGVRATATAKVLNADTSECLKPWAVADKWDDQWEDGAPNPTGEWTVDSEFDKYTKQGDLDPTILNPDVYIPGPSGTGFRPFDAGGNPVDYGLQLTLKIESPSERVSAGWFLALDFCPGAGSGGGADCYRDAIKGCTSGSFSIGDTIPTETGNMKGPTNQGVTGGGPPGEMALIEKDPLAKWQNGQIVDSCAPGICADGQFYAESPRIVAVPLFDVDGYLAGGPSGKESVTIVNILGFFIENQPESGQVTGRLVTTVGLTSGNSSGGENSFLRTVVLIR